MCMKFADNEVQTAHVNGRKETNKPENYIMKNKNIKEMEKEDIMKNMQEDQRSHK